MDDLKIDCDLLYTLFGTKFANLVFLNLNIPINNGYIYSYIRRN